MNTKKTRRVLNNILSLVVLFSMFASAAVAVPAAAAPPVPVTFTILHTNDFHGHWKPQAATRAWRAWPP